MSTPKFQPLNTIRPNWQGNKFDFWHSDHYVVSSSADQREYFSILNRRTNKFHMLNCSWRFVFGLYPPDLNFIQDSTEKDHVDISNQ